MIALSEFFRLVKALKLIRLNFLSYQNAGVVARKKSIALTQIQNARAAIEKWSFSTPELEVLISNSSVDEN